MTDTFIVFFFVSPLFHVQKKSRDESKGAGSGVEILINEPYEDGPGGKGQYTRKIYHVGSHLPGWIKGNQSTFFYPLISTCKSNCALTHFLPLFLLWNEQKLRTIHNLIVFFSFSPFLLFSISLSFYILHLSLDRTLVCLRLGLLPKSALTVEEEAWNAYPYTKTRYTCPFVEKFSLEIETYYFPDDGHQENVFNLDGSDLRNRIVGKY